MLARAVLGANGQALARNLRCDLFEAVDRKADLQQRFDSAAVADVVLVSDGSPEVETDCAELARRSHAG